ncbi:MAG: hypothetical protein ACRC9O_09825 [Plesiomonas sp.]|uniref:hypothetical protein n=1 Tax=Plesiomonas sp. TaxID=2486279 RepID=UPI003F34048E
MKKPRQFIYDMLGIAGFSSAMYGLYLQFGIAVPCIVGGALTLLFSIIVSSRR